MARLLRNSDYLATIQQTDLDQILESTEQYRLDKEQVAQAEMISYLKQRYDVDQIFTNTSNWSPATAYKAKALVIVTASAYDALVVYTADQLIKFTDTYVYICLSTTVAGENPTNTPAKWTKLLVDGSLAYVKLPNPEYDYTVSYVADNIVWYKDRTYKAKYSVINIVPTNTNYWTDLGAYTITAGTLPTNATYFTQGDNRNPLIVQYLVDITLFHLYKRINPRYIPDLRKEAYDGNGQYQTGGAIGWLKKVASGDITADLPKLSPMQGTAISWGNADGTGGAQFKRPTNQY